MQLDAFIYKFEQEGSLSLILSNISDRIYRVKVSYTPGFKCRASKLWFNVDN